MLSVLAAIYGSILAYRLLNFQADVISDVMKITVMIFIVTFILSYFWWTVIVMKLKGFVFSGALAGFLTALCIIPLPTFVGGLKGEILANHDLIPSISASLKYSLSTFSLAEALALPLSAGLGFFIAK